MENKDNISHDGHRIRLINLIEKAGLDNVSDIQAVEGFLTYIFPRGDVNPLAHRLLDKYENFGNILDASIEDLKSIRGINRRSAQKIKMFLNYMTYYSSSKMNKKVSLKNNDLFLDHLEQLLRFQPTENLILFAFDHSFNLIQKQTYDLKQVRSVGLSPLEIYTFIFSTHLSYLVVAHSHPNGTALSSQDDEEALDYMEDIIKHLDCKILDSIIVGNDGIYSCKQKAFLRRFQTMDNNISFI